ncbi:hypothetical protein [Plantactinospora veratri]
MAAAIPFAARAPWLTWAATAAKAAKVRPAAPTPRPKATEPAAGRPLPIRASASSVASSRFAAAVTIMAAARLACRPTTIEPIISVRPVSSFCLVCRTTVRVLMNPASTARKVRIWKAIMSPSLTPVGALRSIRIAGVSTAVRSAVNRAASVGNCSRTAVYVKEASTVVPTIHSGSWIRSRRSASRVSRAVPVKVPPITRQPVRPGPPGRRSAA